jgi:hypothetical protein
VGGLEETGYTSVIHNQGEGIVNLFGRVEKVNLKSERTVAPLDRASQKCSVIKLKRGLGQGTTFLLGTAVSRRGRTLKRSPRICFHPLP